VSRKLSKILISVSDEHRTGSWCTAVSDVDVAHVDGLIGENRRISVDTVTPGGTR
jgi:hypothetical protein